MNTEHCCYKHGTDIYPRTYICCEVRIAIIPANAPNIKAAMACVFNAPVPVTSIFEMIAVLLYFPAHQ